MSSARFVPFVNRLSSAFSVAGGKRLHQAVADAETRLKEIEPPCIEVIDDALAELVSVGATPGPFDLPALEAMSFRAEQINELAGLFQLGDMGTAAWALCELIDICSAQEASAQTAIRSNIRAIQLLRGGDAVPLAERVAVVDGLNRVLEHFRGV